MRPSFHPRLVNGPFDDPGLFIPFLFEKRAFLFDLGDNHALSSRDILKTSHVFVSHTHMDHFVGFDRLLRLCLGRNKTLFLYGPEGFLSNVEGKLSGYCWNLVSSYENRFALDVTEVRRDHLLRKRFFCQDGFTPPADVQQGPFNGMLLAEPALSVKTEILDHNTPCLGFSLEERFHVNIIKENLDGLGLTIGPWLGEFKEALYNGGDPRSEFIIRSNDGGKEEKFELDDLAGKISMITPGQKIAYIADVGYSKGNIKKILRLARDSDHLFIEGAFLDEERGHAKEKCHLTAMQAGTLAGMARAKQFTLFHFSPRYTGMDSMLREEAQKAWEDSRAVGGSHIHNE